MDSYKLIENVLNIRLFALLQFQEAFSSKVSTFYVQNVSKVPTLCNYRLFNVFCGLLVIYTMISLEVSVKSIHRYNYSLICLPV